MENAAFPGEQTLHAAEAWENPALQTGHHFAVAAYFRKSGGLP